MKLNIFYMLNYIWIGIAILAFIVLLFIPAPYGRFHKSGWGKMIDNRVSWILMETPSLFVFSYFLITGDAQKNEFIWFFGFLWVAHYVHRSFIFPFRINTGKKKMPLAVALMAVFFNMVNGFFNGYYLGNLYPFNNHYSISDPGILFGIILFFSGMSINLYSDQILINLRKNSDNGYRIPRGGFFQWVSSPNYFGEIIEWLGFALMVSSLPAFSFFIWTFANLVPRALDNHKWYREHFERYPEQRKAVFPHIL